jgi:hypothetical protein
MQFRILAECESGPQEAPRYLQSLLCSAYRIVEREGGRTPIQRLVRDVLQVLAFPDNGGEFDMVLARLESFNDSDRAAVKYFCRRAVWRAAPESPTGAVLPSQKLLLRAMGNRV